MPEPRRLTARIDQWAAPIFDAAPEDVCWETQLLPMPDGTPGVCIFVWMPSAVMNQKLVGSVMLNPATISANQKEVEVVAKGILEQLREKRSEELSGLSNGHRGGSSGLIVPGR